MQRKEIVNVQVSCRLLTLLLPKQKCNAHGHCLCSKDLKSPPTLNLCFRTTRLPLRAPSLDQKARQLTRPTREGISVLQNSEALLPPCPSSTPKKFSLLFLHHKAESKGSVTRLWVRSMIKTKSRTTLKMSANRPVHARSHHHTVFVVRASAFC
jgi:hypothetical protein